MEIKDLEGKLDEIKSGLESKNKEAIEAGVKSVKDEADKLVKSAQDMIKASEEKASAAAESARVVKEQADKIKEDMDRFQADQRVKAKFAGMGGQEQKSMADMIGDAIDDGLESINNFRSKKSSEAVIEMKAAGEMGAGNFAGNTYAQLTTEYRQNILPLPNREGFLRNVIPGGETGDGGIWYPRYIGGEGEPAAWTEANGDKPLIDMDFDSVNAPVEWIAGVVIMPRKTLDDVKFLRSFLQAELPKKLYYAENNYILNGTGVSPQIQGILPVADTYDGGLPISVERLVDAAYGQINENEHTASHVVLHPRDAVAIALNKAGGSGEYDLPPGTIGFVNGQLTIAGLTVLTTKYIGKGNFLVGDMSAAQFITRLQPEIRFFDQHLDFARKNKIMVRIEERVLQAIYYPNAFIKGTLAGNPTP